MENKQKETATDLQELIAKMNYFTRLKSDHQKHNSFYSTLKISSYFELNQTISALLQSAINLLKENASKTETDVMLLLEIALQLLPADEMELLDELHQLSPKHQ